MSRRAKTAGLTLALLAAGAPGAYPADAASPRHLIYLHGRIVQEQQSARPVHPRFGAYELDAILAAFRERGFAVHGEIRPKGTTVDQAAGGVVAQIRALLAAGVPADRVTIVGASMGAAIAIAASAQLGDSAVRYALLGACLSGTLADRAARGEPFPAGRLLVIREASDETSEPCPPWRSDEPALRTLTVRELRVQTGLAHGFLYRPLPEWLEPVVAFARGRDGGADEAAAPIRQRAPRSTDRY